MDWKNQSKLTLINLTVDQMICTVFPYIDKFEMFWEINIQM